MILADTTSVIQAVSSLVLAVGVLITAAVGWRNGKKADAIKVQVEAAHDDVKLGNLITNHVDEQVTAINGKSLAQLGDAQETRRIEDIPEANRTAEEKLHVAVVPPVAGVPESSA